MNPAPAFRLAACLGLTVLAACTVGPDYVRPTATIPAGFKEAEGWKPAQPAEAASGEPWWSVYSDAGLDAFERQVNVSNQTLKADEAAYREAEAIVAEARAGYFPAVDLTGSALRSGSGGGSSSGKSSLSTGSGSSSNRASVQNSFAATAGASWAPDIWGLIRRTVESDVAIAQASAADLAAAQLSTQITLAIDYIQLRIADETKQLLDDTATDYGRTLQITENKYNAGTAARTDVVTAQAQLENTQSQAIAIGVPRAQYEHAIAVLVGKAPSDVSIALAKLGDAIPVAPAGLPSTLLERNPTIAAAERSMASANAKIGIAVAGYFPSVDLGASYGQTSSVLHTLFSAASSLWSFGLTSIDLPIFNGGLTAAQVAAARAGYDATVAEYRAAVLTGFQQVEDQLSALRILAQQADVQAVAVQDAQEAERLTLNQYEAGTVDYTAVVTAQATTLTSEEAALTIRQSRLLASVDLIEALGGGWDTGQLPNAGAMRDPPSDAPPPARTGASDPAPASSPPPNPPSP